jgi:hypothetical protein
MPKRSRTSKRVVKNPTKARLPKADPNAAAFAVVQSVIKSGEADGKNPLAVALGRLGGLKGGRARADKLTTEQRRASAQKAALARWKRND